LITHDLGVVAEVADVVAVMYGGRILEEAPTEELVRDAQHPYTRALLASMPRLQGDIDDAQAVAGTPPTLQTVPRRGCVFRARCPLKMPICEDEVPVGRVVGNGHRVWCHAEVSS
jgi:peptide/nickel transport system ATP-binding protein